MKDSKYRIHVSLHQEEAQRVGADDRKLEARRVETSKDQGADVLKWRFPSEQAAQPGHPAADQHAGERGPAVTRAQPRDAAGTPDPSPFHISRPTRLGKNSYGVFFLQKKNPNSTSPLR
ncbi:hypothetical protein GNP94_16110, partial [Paenibacillus campinasensis]